MPFRMSKSLVVMSVVLGVGSNLLCVRPANAAIGLAFGQPGITKVGAELMVGGVVFFGGSLVATQISENVDPDLPFYGVDLFLGGLIILDKQVASFPPFTEQDLHDSGYEVHSGDAHRLFVKLEAFSKKFADRYGQGRFFAVKEGDTIATVSARLRAEVDPNAGPEVLDLVAQRMLFEAQAVKKVQSPVENEGRAKAAVEGSETGAGGAKAVSSLAK